MHKPDSGNLYMLLTAIVLVLVVLVCWLLFSVLELNIDTRIPRIYLEWKTIAKLTIVFESGEWWLKLSTLPYKNQWLLAALLMSKKQRKKKTVTGIVKKSKPFHFHMKKVLDLLSGSAIKEWKLFIDTGDYSLNARLFPLNFLPAFQQHLEVNFINRNFLVLRIVHSPWRLLNAWFK